MTNKFLADPSPQHRECGGPLGAYLEGLGVLLDAHGYARATEKEQLRFVAEFSRWLARRRLDVVQRGHPLPARDPPVSGVLQD